MSEGKRLSVREWAGVILRASEWSVMRAPHVDASVGLVPWPRSGRRKRRHIGGEEGFLKLANIVGVFSVSVA